MTETPAETTETETASTGRRSGYLPVLPDGWEYEIRLRATGASSTSSVAITPGDDDRYRVGVVSVSGTRTLWEDTLGNAIRTSVKAAKALSRLAKTEADYAAARKAALDSIGGEDDEPSPEVEEPVSAGDLSRDEAPA